MQALLETIATAPLPADATRLFHGRGGLHPGCEHWALDWYPPAWLLTSYRPASSDELATVHAALAARWQQQAPGQPLCWVHQSRQQNRPDHPPDQGQEGRPEHPPGGPPEGRTTTQTRAAPLPDPQVVTEDGLRYAVHLLRGQNHGLFLDMAEGRRWVSQHVAQAVAAPGHDSRRGLRVLNLFAYTCAFSVVALHAGAREVVNLDMSAAALAVGQHNHRLNGLAAGARFLAHDLFSTWGKLGRSGPYDLVIVDPPSYQKGSFVATKDYARVLRRLPDLLAPGGHALLCLNAPELGPGFLLDALQAAAPGLQVLQRLPNPAAFADAAPERALKVLVCRLPPAEGPAH